MLSVRFLSKTSTNIGGGYINTTLSIFVVLFLFLSISNIKAQDIEPDFNNCTTNLGGLTCDTITSEIEVDYEYKTGCTLRVQARYLECETINGNPHWKFEVDGFSISEGSTGCHDLLDSLYPGWRLGNGTLDEVKYRSMIIGIYKYLSDFRMAIFNALAITPQQRETIWACNNITDPNNPQQFFTAVEGTCMRTCVCLYRVYSPGVGGGHSTVTNNWFFAYKKCYNSCCLVFIRYCWDTSLNPPKWKRTVQSFSNSGDWGGVCPEGTYELPMLEGCKVPREIPIPNILFWEQGECKQTCPDINETTHIDLGL